MHTPTLNASRKTKKTHIGVLPVDWSVVRFADIVESSQYGVSLEGSPTGRTPMLRMNNINGGRIDLSSLAYISVNNGELAPYLLKRNDLLFNRTNSLALVGKTAIFNCPGTYTFASYMVRFRIQRAKADPLFVNYFFNLTASRKRLRALATLGVSQCNINPTVLQKYFFVPLPPVNEQRQIAAILGVWDRAIERQEQLLAAKQRLKQSLMQQLLTGQKRFKEFIRESGTCDTRFGPVAKDWEYVHIGDVAHEVSEKNTDGNEYPVLSCTKHRGLVDSLEFFGKQMFSKNTTTYKIVKRGQYAYATNHIEEGSIGYQDKHDEALISPMYTVFETTDAVDDLFLYKLLKTELYRHIFEVNTSGTINRRGSLRWKQFAAIRVALPSLAEQRRIAAVLETFDKEIALLQREAAALRDQKSGLMQKLLTGKVRVKAERGDG